MRLHAALIIIIAGVIAISCGSNPRSQTTGWEYNNEETTDFSVKPYYDQITGPGLVLIEGGTFIMGRTEEDVMYKWNNMPSRKTVPSFYMDETEVRNVDYREYLNWIGAIFKDYPKVQADAKPDTTVWRRPLAYNEPYVKYYFRHPAFNDYPVVGVSWIQADAYSQWRSDRVNEQILYRQGVLEQNFKDQNANNYFSTRKYLYGIYKGKPNPKNTKKGGDPERISMSDGVLLLDYRLPSEAEWEYAAQGLLGNSVDERIYSRRIYPWNGHYVRNDGKRTPENLGQFMANFQRSRGDMMGVAGFLNDNAAVTNRVDAYWPNDFGLYCMAGNVNEWVGDVYRDLSPQDMAEFNPYRGNVFEKMVIDQNSQVPETHSDVNNLQEGEYHKFGKLKYQPIEPEDVDKNRYVADAYNINAKDGSNRTLPDINKWKEEGVNTNQMYYSQDTSSGRSNLTPRLTSPRTLVSDQSRVFKGGGWRDRVYWLSPGTRRFLDENAARDDLGFRCAMTRVGPNPGSR